MNRGYKTVVSRNESVMHTLVFLCMGAGGDVDVDLVVGRQGAKEFHAETQTDQCGHRAMGNGRGEVKVDVASLNLDEIALSDSELL
jgi:hemolysin activation/secretion protein